MPAHSTGGAVDIRPYDEQRKQFIDMGMFGVIWGANTGAPTFSDNINEEQIKNRLFLLIVASKACLVNYPYEFWHFSTGDRYATYWLNPEGRAIYGGIS